MKPSIKISINDATCFNIKQIKTLITNKIHKKLITVAHPQRLIGSRKTNKCHKE